MFVNLPQGHTHNKVNIVSALCQDCVCLSCVRIMSGLCQDCVCLDYVRIVSVWTVSGW